MTRLLVAAGLVAWIGVTLLLAELRWFSRPTLADRLAPYVPGAWGTRRAGVLSVASFRDAIAPLARTVGERLSRLLGITEPLDRRLRRVHATLDATAFRVRQLGWSLGALGLALLLIVALRPPAPVVLLCLLGAPALAFLLLEQQVVEAGRRWQRPLYLELPVVAEQLVARVRQGRTEAAALNEWADLAEVPAVDRLVAVLALDRETADLASLIAEEARSIRRDVQRELVETMGRRSQKVWIPVTVATLLPGVLFIAVPFIEAVRLFSL